MKIELRTASIIDGRLLRICFPEDDREVIQKLRNIPVIRYESYARQIILSVPTIMKLEELGFIFSSGLKKWWSDMRRHTSGEMIVKEIPGLGGTLYPYQLEGINFIEHKNGRALIADEMGLGKTIQALGWLQLRKYDTGIVLVVCPSSVKVNWKRESQKWTTGRNIQILSGQVPYHITGDLIIINFDILSYWMRALLRMNIKTLIVDEAHYIKNSRTQRTKALKRIAKSAEYLVALTGTPIENRPAEIYNIIFSIDPTIFPNHVQFGLRYCEAKKGRYGWDDSGASNTTELHQILTQTVMIRRKKKDVLKQLPPKQFVKVSLEIDNRHDYAIAEEELVNFINHTLTINPEDIDEEVKKELKQYAKDHDIEIESEDLTKDDIESIRKAKIKSTKSNPVLTRIEALKQLAVQGKLNQIIEWIKDFMESGEKLVVFAIHRKVVAELIKHFPGAVKIQGGMTSYQKQKVVDEFQNNPKVKLLIGNIQAAGVGITLTAASKAAIIQFPWSPGVLVQASDRLHRISQTKQVTIYNLVGEDTIEEKIIDILIKKDKVISQVLDGEYHKDKSILVELIKSYKR